jgi:hypothetical protein
MGNPSHSRCRGNGLSVVQIRLSALISFMLLNTAAGMVQAQGSFALVSKETSVQGLLAEISASLPDQMKQEIGKTITVTFKQTDKNDKVYFACDKQLKTLTHPAYVGDVVPGIFNNADELNINKNFLPLLAQPGYQECGLTAKDYFKKTVYHELAHIFDFLKFRDATETAYFNEHCAYDNKKPIPWCSRYRRLGRFSDDMQFMNIDNWDTSKESKNTRRKNAVDPYVFKNSQESFAVYFETFMTDPEFACRKPALYNFYSGILKVQPFGGRCKTLNTQVFYRNQALDMNPARLYQAHLFLAAKGEGFSSRWGHAMMRLVFCAPNRTKVDEKCLEDVSHHIIVSFRANIDTLTIDNLKGVTGKYPSQMFLIPQREVIADYTEVELRDIQSIPLNLNQNQKRLLVEKTLETYWDYRGKYYFFSNNCASETMSMIFSVLDDGRKFELQKYNDQIGALSPVALAAALKDFGIATWPSLTEAQLIDKGFLFKSDKLNLDMSYQYMRKLGPAAMDSIGALVLEDYLTKTSSDQREQLIAKLHAANPAKSTGLFSAANILETNIKLRLESNLRTRIAQKIIDMPGLENTEQFQNAKKIQGDTIENSVLDFRRAKYGLPTIPEGQQIASKLNLTQKVSEMEKAEKARSYEALMKELPEFGSNIIEILKNKRNLENIFNELSIAISN